MTSADMLAPNGIADQVAQGCGPGMARGRGGMCRPMRGGGYGRPMMRSRCVVRRTPFGPRRVCR